jgi:hypothetical protein
VRVEGSAPRWLGYSRMVDEQSERARVEELLREWDPIGIISTLIEDGLPPSEYDSYAPHVHRTLTDGCTAESLALTLGLIRTRSMGLPANPSADLIIAEKMVAWWDRTIRMSGSHTREGRR